MISSRVEFEESIAFERSALAALAPLVPTSTDLVTKDFESNAITLHMKAMTFGMTTEEAVRSEPRLRPMAFGSAWKVLDLLLELAFSNTDSSSRRSQRMTIADKQRRARARAGACRPLSEDNAVWNSLCATYDMTAEHRHAFVHRRAIVGADGALSGTGDDGRPLVTITASCIDAFCRAVQRSADAVLAARISNRERADLAWQLDLIRSISGAVEIGGAPMETPVMLETRPELRHGMIELDVPKMLQGMRANWPTRSYFDLQVALPDRTMLRGELDSAPQVTVRFALNDHPSWLVAVT